MNLTLSIDLGLDEVREAIALYLEQKQTASGFKVEAADFCDKGASRLGVNFVRVTLKPGDQ